MSVIYMLIMVSVVVAIIFFVLFVRAVKSGQYDDSYTPSVRILFEDEVVDIESSKDNNSSKSIK